MNAAKQELFDVALLRVLDANRSRWGQTIAAMAHGMAEFGFTSADPQVVLERIHYLVGKNLAEEVSKIIGRANRAWRITEDGLAFLDQHG